MSNASRRVQTPLTLALRKHREQFSPYKVSHVDSTGRVIRFADQKTRGIPFDINQFSMPYNPNRMSHVNLYEGIKDPNATIAEPRPQQPKQLDYPDLAIKTTTKRDRESKEIQDYTGRVIVKVDVNPDEELKAKHWI